MLGYHVGKDGRQMHKALEAEVHRLVECGFKPAAQIFVVGPQSSRENLSPAERAGTAKAVKEMGFDLVIHGAYIDYPWKLSHNGIKNIRRELTIAAEVGATGVVVHLGPTSRIDEVLDKIFDTPEQSMEGYNNPKPLLWLETNSAKPSENTYETPEKLQALFAQVARSPHAQRVGLCVDTAHLFACGVALRSRIDAERWLAELPDVPVMFHLNDSASKLGSGKDLHAGLFDGEIWRMYHPETGQLEAHQSGLVAVLEYAYKHNMMLILERAPGRLDEDLRLIKLLGF